MKLSHSVDVAAQMVSHSDHILRDENPIADGPLHEFWVYGRNLMHSWLQNLSVCQKVLESSNPIRRRHCWLEYEPDLRDILRADVLVRSWYSILAASDQIRGVRHSEPIARSILSAQLQVRIRCLKIVLIGQQIDAARMRRLNELRKSSELWSDFLCGYLAKTYDIKDVLYDQTRVDMWCQQPLNLTLNGSVLGEQTSQDAEALRPTISAVKNSTSLNCLHRLAQTMLNCFPDSAFDEHGVLREF